MDPAGRESPRGGAVDETRKPALSPFCLFCPDVGQLLGSAVSLEGVSSKALQPKSLPGPRRLPGPEAGQLLFALGVPGSPGALPGAGTHSFPAFS